MIFGLAAAVAGLGGVMLGIFSFNVNQNTAPPLIGLFWLAIVVTFGVRRPGGALLAGLAFTCGTAVFQWIGDVVPGDTATSLVTSIYFVPILSGLGAINLAQEPDGILSLAGQKKLAKDRAKRHALLAATEAQLEGQDIADVELPTSAEPTTPSWSRPPCRTRTGTARGRTARRPSSSRPGRRRPRSISAAWWPATATSRSSTASTSPWSPARSSRCSGPTAPASPRCAGRGRRSSNPTAGRCGSTATTSPPSRPSGAPTTASCSSPRPAASSPASPSRRTSPSSSADAEEREKAYDRFPSSASAASRPPACSPAASSRCSASSPPS